MGGRGGDGIRKLTAGGGGPRNGGVPDLAPDVQETKDIREAIGKKGRQKSMDDAILKSNPYFSPDYAAFSENCQRAVVAYELRRRGYDVVAKPTYAGDVLPRSAHTNADGSHNGRWMGAFQNAKAESVARSTVDATRKALEDKMRSFGNGARAILMVQWKQGGGHVINIENRGGRIYYNDGQVGGRYDARQLLSVTKLPSVALVRTDNLRISARVTKSVELAGSRTNTRKDTTASKRKKK